MTVEVLLRYDGGMPRQPDIARIAALIADPSRAAMLLALMSGQDLAAGELALVARVSAQTASAHLSKLVAGGLLSRAHAGRQRRYRLRDPRVARALEALLVLAPTPPARGLNDGLEQRALVMARTCYDHLAGKLGMAITDALVERDWVRVEAGAFALTVLGARWLTRHGLDLEAVRGQRRLFAPLCLDWSERRPHIAGSLGTALANWMLAARWVTRLPATRALRVTDLGRRQLQHSLGIRLDQESHT